jgi:L-lactate dehydrogenase (cytochrome)
MPSQLRDVSNIDLTTRVLGHDLAVPFLLSPTGSSRLIHHDKEIGVARAAEKFGALYTISTMGNTSLEDIATLSDGPLMFQIYILRDRELTREFVRRTKAAGIHALCLTVDISVAGNRERDLVSGMTMPPRLTPQSLWSYATHPRWGLSFLLHPEFRLANVDHRVDAIGKGSMALIEYVNSQFDRSVTWDDVAWLAEQWNGPFVIKGLLSPEDARRARDVGATALMISNHGGRQLDSAPAPMDCIGAIRDAVGSDLELILDGGIRRGTHILKAIAGGANAVSIGRPYLYGLAAGGQDGVMRALEILRSEVARSMALMGCASIEEIDRDKLISKRI